MPDEAATVGVMLEQMKDDVTTLRRIAELVWFNSDAFVELAKRRSRLFEGNEKSAQFLVQCMRDLLNDFSEQLAEAVERAEKGDVNLKARVVDKGDGGKVH